VEVPAGIERFRALSDAEFAARARAARAYADLTLEEAGRLLGISRQALSRRETSQVGIPISDRFVLATVYCQLTGWPEGFFVEEKWEAVPLPIVRKAPLRKAA
jgi:transcriptional regulator with XRE-family HTH domain